MSISDLHKQFGMFESLEWNENSFSGSRKAPGMFKITALNATFQLSGTFKRKFLANQA